MKLRKRTEEIKVSKPKKKTLSEIKCHKKDLGVWREKSFVDIDMGLRTL